MGIISLGAILPAAAMAMVITGFTDAELQKLGQSGNQVEAYKIFQTKYGLSQKQVEELMMKLGNYLV